VNKDFCPPVRDQLNCGSCTAFGTVGTWETILAKENKYVDLSERDLFACSEGDCGYGNYIEDTIMQAQRGVALEADAPYDGVDHACGDKPPDWWKRGWKVLSWEVVKTFGEIKEHLLIEPLVGSMIVRQSFMNYTSGVYHNLGEGDPIIGNHCIELVDYDPIIDAILIRNSWGLGWGMAGYAWVDLNEIDPKAFSIETSDVPLTDPGPPPSIWQRLWWKIEAIIRRIFGRR